jgi:Ion channel
MARPQPQRARRGVLAPAGDRYGLLLVLLVGTYALSAFTHARLIVVAQIVVFVTALLLALRGGRLRRRSRRLITAAVIAGSGIALVLLLVIPGPASRGLASLWAGLILLVTAVLIVQRVLARDVVTIQSIYGAVSAYMIIGLMFASWYGAIGHLDHGSFFADRQPANIQTYQYFSFTTLTTLGYGDFTAANSGGRAFAVIEALTGQVFLATLVARLVASFRTPRPPGTGPGSDQARVQQPATKHRSALKRHLG